MEQILESISQSVSQFVTNKEISSELEGVEFKQGDLLLINNSFIYREKTSIKTTKNDSYLAIPIKGDGTMSEVPIVLAGMNINSDWKRLPESARGDIQELALEDAVENEFSNLGRLVFILIGKVDDSVVIRQPISSRHFSEIVWDPRSNSILTMSDDTIVIKDAIDEEAIWQEIETNYELDEQKPPEELRDALAVALENLKNDAVANLILPSKERQIQGSMIDSILTVLREQRDEYQASLSNAQRGDIAPNDVLRIAYNFASDALIFIRLVISICDLKPIVLWGTLNEHYQLAYSLKNLPWHTQRTKPSIKNYRKTIADARNSAFHNLFPFRKSLLVDLHDAALQDAVLRIFSEHGKKKENQLLYQDKELVDLLFEFTRARERNVPLSFWRRNLSVMDATIDLCKATGEHLKLLLIASGV
ncbi:MAG: hypothetical protein H8D23_32355 [Candidatus Brocadiales bacterium]|nr:hypothetical protein [Candidatus Brocadiales bacterium]